MRPFFDTYLQLPEKSAVEHTLLPLQNFNGFVGKNNQCLVLIDLGASDFLKISKYGMKKINRFIIELTTFFADAPDHRSHEVS